VPFAILTANAAFGAAVARVGIGRLPEETSPTALRALALPVLETAASPALSGAAEATQCSSA
jgi:hypothetical protein